MILFLSFVQQNFLSFFRPHRRRLFVLGQSGADVMRRE
jgi:hypothetical protein